MELTGTEDLVGQWMVFFIDRSSSAKLVPGPGCRGHRHLQLRRANGGHEMRRTGASAMSPADVRMVIFSLDRGSKNGDFTTRNADLTIKNAVLTDLTIY